jgi:hypothetical protein
MEWNSICESRLQKKTNSVEEIHFTEPLFYERKNNIYACYKLVIVFFVLTPTLFLTLFV